MTNPTPARRPRRWWKALAAVAGPGPRRGRRRSPGWSAPGPGRSRVAGRLNRALAPGRLEFAALERLLVRADPARRRHPARPEGARRSPRSPSAIARPDPRPVDPRRPRGRSTLTLDGAALDVERSADGSIDLAEALRTVIASPDPKRDLTVKIAGGSLRYRDPFLAEPVDGRRRSTWTSGSAPRPTRSPGRSSSAGATPAWKSRAISTAGSPGAARPGRPSSRSPSSASAGRSWPGPAGVDASGRLDGSLDFAPQAGGDGGSRATPGSSASRPGAARSGATPWPSTGSTPAGTWPRGRRAGRSAGSRLTSPLGDLKAEGQLDGPAGPGKQRIEGRLDLAAHRPPAPARPPAPRRPGRRPGHGPADRRRRTASRGQTTYDVEARVADLAARDRDRALSLRDPATFTARLIRDGEASSLERLAVKTSFLDASARGKLAEGVDLTGPSTSPASAASSATGSTSASSTSRAGPRSPGPTRSAPAAADPPDDRGRLLGRRRSRFDDRSSRPRSATSGSRGSGRWPIRRDLRPRSTASTSTARPSASGWPDGLGGLADRRVGLGRRGLGSTWHSRAGAIAGPASASQARRPSRPPDARPSPVRELDGELDGRRPGPGDRPASAFELTRRPDRPARGPDRGDGPGPARPVDRRAGPRARPRTLARRDRPGRRRAPGLRARPGAGGPPGRGELAGDRPRPRPSCSPTWPAGRRWGSRAGGRRWRPPGATPTGVQLAGKLGLDEPPGRPGSRPGRPRWPSGPTTRRRADRLDLSEFTVSTAYGTLDASGRLDDPAGRPAGRPQGDARRPTSGRSTPCWPSGSSRGRRSRGKPRAFRASGTLGRRSDAARRGSTPSSASTWPGPTSTG